MRRERAHELLAASWMTTAIINGAIAIGQNNEAIRAETTATIYEQQGYYTQAAEWEAHAYDKRDARNIYGGLLFLI